MKLLLFDTETTGLIPRGNKLPQPDTIHLFPYAVQISFVLYDDVAKELLEIHDHVVLLPDGVEIPPETTAIHGISTERMRATGVPLEQVMEQLIGCLRAADRVVAHNLEFDYAVLQADLARRAFSAAESHATQSQFRRYLHAWGTFPEWYCTMRSMTDVCQLQCNKYGRTFWKFPKLAELHAFLFGDVPDNLHNALCDVLVTLRCYLWMQHQLDVLEESSSFRYAVRAMQLYPNIPDVAQCGDYVEV